jgi:predicted nucleic acid-binding protein
MGVDEVKLVDTSSWIDYLRGLETTPSQRVAHLVVNEEAGWCDMIAVELWNGVRGVKEKKDLAALEAEITLFPVDAGVWAKARQLSRVARDKGITAPATDIIIAACAAHYGLEIEHCDAHFHSLIPCSSSL